MAELLAAIGRLFSKRSAGSVERDLKQAGMRINAAAYLGLSILISISLSFISAYLLLPVLNDFTLSLASLLLSFALFLAISTRIPSLLKKRRASLIEADLPIALRAIGSELDMKIPFEDALAHASSDAGACPQELRTALLNISRGVSAGEALSSSASRVDSLAYKRAMGQLQHAYEQGGGGEALKQLAGEMLGQQQARSREYSSKAAFLGLMFIAVSAILPALFQAYLIVGSSFLALSLTSQQIWLIYLLAFPLADLAIIAYVWFSAPTLLSLRRPARFLSEEEFMMLERSAPSFLSSGLRRKFKSISLVCAAGFILFAAAGLYSKFAIYFAFSSLVLPVLVYLYLNYLLEKRNDAIDAALPDALLSASSLQRGIAAERVFSSIAKSGQGPLSEEFARASKQMAAGESVPSALASMARRNSSLLLDRSVRLLSAGYSTGTSLYSSLREAAADIFEVFAIVRDRRAQIAMQKYTLLIGGGLFVPLILGSLLGVVGKIDLGSSDILGIPQAQRDALVQASAGSAQAYLIIYSLLTSLLISHLDGERRKFFLYFIALAPLTLALFLLASTSSIL